MGYANPILTIPYTWDNFDFGNGDGAVSFQGPSGLTGRIREVIAYATETFNSVTTEAFINIGTVADADAYASVALGDLADTDTFVASKDDPDWNLQTDALPADTQVEVAF